MSSKKKIKTKKTKTKKIKKRTVSQLITEFKKNQKKHIINVKSELNNGLKTSHWIWYFFPSNIDKITLKYNLSENTLYYSFYNKTEVYAFLNTPYLLKNYIICLKILEKTIKKTKKSQKYIMDSFNSSYDSEKVDKSKEYIKLSLIKMKKEVGLNTNQRLLLTILNKN